MKKFVALIFLTLVALGIMVASYVGAFRPVHLEKKNSEILFLLAKDYMGPYHKMVPTIETVEKWSKQNGLLCTDSFGEYFDDPDIVEESRLKARGGCLLNENERASLGNIPKDFKLIEIPTRSVIEVSFEGAPSIGPMKVYPKAAEFMHENNLAPDGAVIEIYHVINEKQMTTTYHFPVKVSK